MPKNYKMIKPIVISRNPEKPKHDKFGNCRCNECDIGYNYFDADACIEHRTYHDALWRGTAIYGIYANYKVIDRAIDCAIEIMDDTSVPRFNRLRAVGMFLLAKYSKYYIANLRVNIQPKMNKDDYISEWVKVNKEEFPEDLLDEVIKIWVGTKSFDLIRKEYDMRV